VKVEADVVERLCSGERLGEPTNPEHWCIPFGLVTTIVRLG
jgi:hypothetical protein